MSELILHHYAVSPFAEKIRVILGYKQLSYRSVDIPVVMPKPDLVALTGGYRKTPVLQIGCDVYCDTSLIARVLDAQFPERPVFRAKHAALEMAAARWFDRYLFLAAIGQLFDPEVAPASVESLGGPAAAAAFAADRTPMMKGAPGRPSSLGEGRLLIAQVLRQLETQLAEGGPFLFGPEVGWADFCAYHPLWALRQNRALAQRLTPYARVLNWLDRIAAFGQGTPSPLSSGEALSLARASQPRAMAPSDASLSKLRLGDEVEVAATDYGVEPSVGRLVYVAEDEVAIERDDERAGRVVVHFPRIGFKVKARA
jgi:glutathione S-transferase